MSRRHGKISSVREPTIARDTERRAGVIDTLSAGYATVNRHPWILTVPVLLDLFFWLGPHLSMRPLVERYFGANLVPTGLSADVLQAYEQARETVIRAGDSFNLFTLLVAHFPGIPSLMAARDGAGPSLDVADSGILLAALFLLPVLGLGLAAVYYVTVGMPVIGSVKGAAAVAGRAWRTWVRLVAFMLMVLAFGFLVGVPTGVLVLLFGGPEGSLAGFMGAFLSVVALWTLFYLFFVVDAMVVSDVGPFHAMRNSIAVVRSNTGSTLGLAVLIWIITLGMPLVWDAIAQNAAGIVVGILGNAYIASGLAVASMTFYRDRFAALNR